MYYQNMPLYLGLYKLLITEYQLVENLPRLYKHTLGQNIIDITWKMLDLFIQVQVQLAGDPKLKRQTIKEIDCQQQCLVLRLRLLGELKLIPVRQQARLNVQTLEIGKMIGNWLKHV